MSRSDADTIATLTRIAKDLHWMARRYASGRRSYATSLFNEHVRALLAMGIELNPTGDGTIWARDGDNLDGLTAEERATDKPDAWERWRDEEASEERRRLHTRIGELEKALAALAERTPIYDDAADRGYCCYCDACLTVGDGEHKAWCPWVAAAGLVAAKQGGGE